VIFLLYYYKLPNRDTCESIVEKYPVVFSLNGQQVQGVQVESYNYRIPERKILAQPFLERPEVSAMELRGITFVTDSATGVTKRFLMLPKFYNIEEADETSWETVKEKIIDNVTVKRDGSLIRFIDLPNGRIIAKTQKMIGNEQALCAEKLLSEDEGLREFVKWSLEERVALLFELTAPDNQVVLAYSETRLTLVKAREEETGRFIPLFNLESLTAKYGIDVVEDIKITGLSDLIDLAKGKEMFEGWVIQFSCGQLMKLKTSWYAGVHNLCTSEIRENEIIKLSVGGRIDDVVSALRLLGRQDVIDQILPIHRVVSDHISSELGRIAQILSGFNGDKKAFAEKYRDDSSFGIIMSSCTKLENLEKFIKEKFIKATKTQKEAVEWLEDMEGKE